MRVRFINPELGRFARRGGVVLLFVRKDVSCAIHSLPRLSLTRLASATSGEKPQRLDRAFRSWLQYLTGAEATGDWRAVPIPGGGSYLRLNEDRLHRVRIASSIDSSMVEHDLSSETLSLLASVLAFSDLSVLYPEDYRQLRAHARSHPDKKTMLAIEVRLLDYLC